MVSLSYALIKRLDFEMDTCLKSSESEILLHKPSDFNSSL